MALITCPECKKKVSDTAAACPNCGFQLTPAKVSEIKGKEQQAQKTAGIGCLVVIAIFFILYLIGSFSSDTGGGNQSTSPGTRTNAPTGENPGKIEAWVMAQEFVKDRLKSPSSANFGGIFSDYQSPHDVVTDIGGGKFRVRAWVDAQNSFGAMIRTHFVCELEYAGNDCWRLLSLDFKE
jgi:hypothetical protein